MSVATPPGQSDDYIKRVIGLPGDTVEVRGGTTLLNGRELQRRPLPVVGAFVDIARGAAAAFREAMGEERPLLVVQRQLHPQRERVGAGGDPHRRRVEGEQRGVHRPCLRRLGRFSRSAGRERGWTSPRRSTRTRATTVRRSSSSRSASALGSATRSPKRRK